MTDTPSIVTILGYSLFAFSEIIPLLPIPANGLLHSIVIGLKNSISNKKPTEDAEIAHVVLDKQPDIANVVSTLQGNFRLIEAMRLLNAKPNVLAQIEKLSYDKNLQFINTLLINHPDIINEIKKIIVNKISNPNEITQQLTQEPTTQPITNEDVEITIPNELN
jgi:hypothetical protein